MHTVSETAPLWAVMTNQCCSVFVVRRGFAAALSPGAHTRLRDESGRWETN